MKNFLILLLLIPTFSFAMEGDNPLEEKIKIYFDIDVEKCTTTPHGCTSTFDLSERKIITLKGTPEYSEGWLTLSKTLYGMEFKSNLRISKTKKIREGYFYGIFVVLYYLVDGDPKSVQFNTAIENPNNLSIITIQGGSFGSTDLNYSPIVIFGGSHLVQGQTFLFLGHPFPTPF